MDRKFVNLGMGWLRDIPDFRDYTIDTDTVAEKKLAFGQKIPIKVMLTEPTSMDDMGRLAKPLIISSI